MCIACCDPVKLKVVAPQERPNCVTIPASGFISVTTPSDAIVRLSDAGHYAGSPLTLESRNAANGGACAWRRQGSTSLFIPGPGDWIIRNGGASKVQVDIFTTYCGAAFHAYNQTGYEGPTHSTITTDNTPASTIVLAANRNRAYALFINDSDAVMYLAFGPAAALNSGVRLNVAGTAGDRYEMKGSSIWRGVVNGIQVGTGATKKILVTEGV